MELHVAFLLECFVAKFTSVFVMLPGCTVNGVRKPIFSSTFLGTKIANVRWFKISRYD